MKASALIKTLTDQLAANGDLEIYIRAIDPGSYGQLHDTQVGVASIHRERGKQRSYVDGNKARQLGYDLDDRTHGITLG